MTTGHFFIASAVLAVGVSAQAASAKPPPALPGVECALTGQRLHEGLALQVRFVNTTARDALLAPEPHLALFRDAAATRQMGITVRADTFRVHDLVVPAHGAATADYRVEPGLVEALRCNGAAPMAAALVFRTGPDRQGAALCVLRGFSPGLVPMNDQCPGGEPLPAPAGAR